MVSTSELWARPSRAVRRMKGGTVRPMLDDLELPQVQEILTSELRMLAEHKPPGMEGSLLQNLGRRPTALSVRGVATGPGAEELAGKLDRALKEGGPVPFIADIVADAGIQGVVLDDVTFEEVAGHPQRVEYVLALREHIEPVEPQDVSGLEDAIADEAGDLVSGLVDGLAAAQEFADGLEKIVPDLGDMVERLTRFRDAVSRASGP